jgi:hypothetical protein
LLFLEKTWGSLVVALAYLASTTVGCPRLSIDSGQAIWPELLAHIKSAIKALVQAGIEGE